MKALKAFVALLVVASSGLIAYRVVIPRLECNRVKQLVNSETVRLDRSGVGYERTATARKLADLCRRCLERYPNDYNFHVFLGANLNMLGDAEGAEASYARALELNERPEIYGYLATVQLQRGKPEEARENLYRGALFNLTVAELVSEPLRSEIGRLVIARHEALGSANTAERVRRFKEYRKKAMERRGR